MHQWYYLPEPCEPSTYCLKSQLHDCGPHTAQLCLLLKPQYIYLLQIFTIFRKATLRCVLDKIQGLVELIGTLNTIVFSAATVCQGRRNPKSTLHCKVWHQCGKCMRLFLKVTAFYLQSSFRMSGWIALKSLQEKQQAHTLKVASLSTSTISPQPFFFWFHSSLGSTACIAVPKSIVKYSACQKL